MTGDTVQFLEEDAAFESGLKLARFDAGKNDLGVAPSEG